MPSWSEIADEFVAEREKGAAALGAWVENRLQELLATLSGLRDDRNVILYTTAFMQQPDAPSHQISTTYEDHHALRALTREMDPRRGLTLILHTHGGHHGAGEGIGSALRGRFDDFEVVVPLMAMSAGTLIALASDRIVMSAEAQLGPIDPQMRTANGLESSQTILEQLGRARKEMKENPINQFLWQPILPSLGPSLVMGSCKALRYTKVLATRWLSNRMLAGDTNPKLAAERALNTLLLRAGVLHHSRIDRQAAEMAGLLVDPLEENKQLERTAWSLMDLAAILFANTPLRKILASDSGRSWSDRCLPIRHALSTSS